MRYGTLIFESTGVLSESSACVCVTVYESASGIACEYLAEVEQVLDALTCTVVYPSFVRTPTIKFDVTSRQLHLNATKIMFFQIVYQYLMPFEVSLPCFKIQAPFHDSGKLRKRKTLPKRCKISPNRDMQ